MISSLTLYKVGQGLGFFVSSYNAATKLLARDMWQVTTLCLFVTIYCFMLYF